MLRYDRQLLVRGWRRERQKGHDAAGLDDGVVEACLVFVNPTNGGGEHVLDTYAKGGKCGEQVLADKDEAMGIENGTEHAVTNQEEPNRDVRRLRGNDLALPRAAAFIREHHERLGLR
jgi:hypothetical protein